MVEYNKEKDKLEEEIYNHKIKNKLKYRFNIKNMIHCVTVCDCLISNLVIVSISICIIIVKCVKILQVF